jgi:hypothetical protein
MVGMSNKFTTGFVLWEYDFLQREKSMTAKTPAPFSLNSDFRMSLGWAIVLVLFLALLFISVSSPDIALSERMKTLYLTCLFYLLALSAWLLNSWQPLLGRWLLVSGLATLVFLGAFWVGEATFLCCSSCLWFWRWHCSDFLLRFL